MPKSTVEEIRARFDADVERFSNLETGQSAAIDSPLCLELIAQVSSAVSPHAKSLLDVGCGAGNYTLKLLQALPNLDCTLVDLSLPMLERARQRVEAATSGPVHILQGDIRDIELGEARFDVIVAAAVLHHLRSESEWLAVFRKFHQALTTGGCLWVFDMVEHTLAPVQNLMTTHYGDYLNEQGGAAYRDKVFAYIEKEDTPTPLMQQLDWLRTVGFEKREVLHKSSCFAAFGAVKD
ncbi:MAG TPA: class I SAM-dependent methyltransferase [Abditibacteriaceae bacterium]|jgi:tRNA (cmo5U34)-methyltransferase